jgi:hypothetical protein
MDRRTFLCELTLGALAAPLATQAQPHTGKVWRVGVLLTIFAPDADPPQAFRQHLGTLGYVEGQNLVIDWRYTRGARRPSGAMSISLLRT